MVKPVVSSLNAWSWYTSTSAFSRRIHAANILSNSVVVSVFAIIILSVIGGLFKVRPCSSPDTVFGTQDFSTSLNLRGRNAAPWTPWLTYPVQRQANHHTMTGSTKDPENGPAVAVSVFAAVVVYAVRPTPTRVQNTRIVSLIASSYLCHRVSSPKTQRVFLKSMGIGRYVDTECNSASSSSAVSKPSCMCGLVKEGRYH